MCPDSNKTSSEKEVAPWGKLLDELNWLEGNQRSEAGWNRATSDNNTRGASTGRRGSRLGRDGSSLEYVLACAAGDSQSGFEATRVHCGYRGGQKSVTHNLRSALRPLRDLCAAAKRRPHLTVDSSADMAIRESFLIAALLQFFGWTGEPIRQVGVMQPMVQHVVERDVRVKVVSLGLGFEFGL